jgi:quinolinate synthase
VAELRKTDPDARLLAHPQSPPAVAAAADYVGAAEAMADWIKIEKPSRVAVLGDSNITDNLAVAAPETTFIRANGADPARTHITLESVLWSLHTMTEEIAIPSDVVAQARAPIQRMLALSP